MCLQTYPGKFLLSYMPRARCQHEYITVTPEGFRFRQQNFESLTMLFKWFKEHFRDPIPGNTPSTPRGQVTGRTPYPGTPSLNMASKLPRAARAFFVYGLCWRDFFCPDIDPAIQRVAQSMPTHMLQSLSQVASQTPHYPHAYGYANTVSCVLIFLTYHRPSISFDKVYGFGNIINKHDLSCLGRLKPRLVLHWPALRSLTERPLTHIVVLNEDKTTDDGYNFVAVHELFAFEDFNVLASFFTNLILKSSY